MHRLNHWLFSSALLSAALILLPAFSGHSNLFAETLCVNPGGTNGCYASIGAAVTAARVNDTINVAAGTYSEDVLINKPVSIVGADRSATIVDATGRANGFYIDGMDHPGLGNVTITGFTVQNANFEGILITNAYYINIWGNNVVSNDKGLDLTTFTCPGLPSWETSEQEDCGEGIHLNAVDHSTITSNMVQQNAGGMLLTDETGVTHNNLISGNTVHDNPYDCGITLASHPPAPGYAPKPYGLAYNTIYANTSYHNGTQVPGAGAGIGVFDSVPGTSNRGNVIVGNTSYDNGLPGIAMHSHAPNQVLVDTIIAGNTLYNNAADTEDAATPGPTGINVYGVSAAKGTIISQNSINNEEVDVAINTPAPVLVNLNNLLATGLNYGLDNIGNGPINGTENWWGCASGPGTSGCSTVNGNNVLVTPWLTSAFSLSAPSSPSK